MLAEPADGLIDFDICRDSVFFILLIRTRIPGFSSSLSLVLGFVLFPDLAIASVSSCNSHQYRENLFLFLSKLDCSCSQSILTWFLCLDELLSFLLLSKEPRPVFRLRLRRQLVNSSRPLTQYQTHFPHLVRSLPRRTQGHGSLVSFKYLSYYGGHRGPIQSKHEILRRTDLNLLSIQGLQAVIAFTVSFSATTTLSHRWIVNMTRRTPPSLAAPQIIPGTHL
ncbi:hypothetical protein DFH08DRAFT_43740 [Mycena albidolilacea]|uniref:Uncharacterized protein n=1 Tax=Mycena albidolilacea TaxID=1033008 RepID=A0AAD7EXE0_9AGAR|nr:hypothetical protein DFH08DRAFT_43740 [Mycena albidolilacea]